MKDDKERLPMVLDLEFELEEFVVLRADPERNAGMVTGILVRPGGFVRYGVTRANGQESDHFGCELRRVDEPTPEVLA